MTDRELLELAAKAIGGTLSEGTARKRVGETWDKFEWIGPAGINTGMDWLPHPKVTIYPLENDGDALRLAVKLRVDVSHDEIGMKSFVYVRTAFNDEHHIGLSEIFDDDSERPWRTRRAILRAAAEIGKAMG